MEGAAPSLERRELGVQPGSLVPEPGLSLLGCASGERLSATLMSPQEPVDRGNEVLWQVMGPVSGPLGGDTSYRF